MRYLYFKVAFCFFILLTLSAAGQTFQQTGRIAGVGFDRLSDLATDGSDNLYAVGSFTNQITDPVTILTTSTIVKSFLIKYNSSGTVSWSKGIYPNSGSVKINKTAVDNAGNVFVCGSFNSTMWLNGFDIKRNILGPSTSAPDGFIAKYTSDGYFLWVRAIGSNDYNDEFFDMVLDSNGDAYVTGYISADAKIYGRDSASTTANTGTLFSQGGSPGLLDAIVVKYANNGTYKWGFSLGSTDGTEKGTAITVDASNNIYVAGQLFNIVDFDPSAATVNLTESSPMGSGDCFVAKYTTLGDFVTVGQISGVGQEIINHMHIGSSGALNVAGYFTGFIDADLRSGNSQNLTASGSGKDILFAKYNLTTFAPVFIQKMGGNNVDDEAIGIKANSSGDCYLTGYFSGSGINFNPAGTALNLTSTGGKDAFISKYNSSGVNTWAFNVGSATDDQGSAMDFNSSAFVYAGGFYSGSIGDFNPGSGTSTLTNLGSDDSYWAKYQECSSVPVISTQPTAQTVCAGATINLSTVVSGSGILYQWKKDGIALTDGGTISGATSTNLTITSSTAANAGAYTCEVSSCGTNVTSNSVNVVVNQPPSITTQPVSSSICAGATASFSVVATGTLLSYKWKLDGVDISNNAVYSGANAATLNLVSTTSANQGTYTCEVGGICSPKVTTNGAILTIKPLTVISTNPVNQIACLGGNATFSVVAAGSTLIYKWQKNGVDMVNGGSISGATTNTLTITGVVAGDATNYKCIVTGDCGNATSTVATLSITASPAITSQPIASQNICIGKNASFSIVATGAVSYQWKKDGADLTNAGNVSGALTASLLISSITASDIGTYTCVVTGACNPVATSSNSVLNANTLPAISVQPVASTICAGATASFNITASGTGITYQWKKNGADITNSANVFGAQSASLSITGTSTTDAGNYTCVVGGTCLPPVTSASVALVVNSTAAITSNPSSVSICAGQATSFTLGTTGSGISYQWKKNGTDLTNGGNISGAISSVLTLSTTSSADAGNYSCTITNTCSGTLNSTIASLTVKDLPAITTQPADVTICGSSTVNFSVVATGTGLNYQWKKGTTVLTDGGAISGATTANLAITPAVAGDAGAYTVTVSGACTPAVTSNVANLAVGTVAAITIQPTDKIACQGTTTTLSITVSGTGNSYQWRKNGVDLVNDTKISGATSATLTIANLSATDADIYTCRTGNTCSGFIVSSPAAIIVNTLPSITTQPSDISVCTGTTASLSVSATGTSLTYLWKKNGVALADGGSITGAATASLSIASASVTDDATYTVEVSGTCTPKVISTGATLSVGASTTIISQPVSKIACTGGSTVFVCNATGGTITYKWKKGSVDLIDGGNITGSSTSTLTINNLTASDADTYVCVVSSLCSSSINSNAVTLTVNTSTVISAQPTDKTTCAGTSASFSVTASGSGLTYQWNVDGTDIIGATNSTYSIASVSTSDAGFYVSNISSACGVVSSSSALLAVDSPVSIVSQTSDVSACPGEDVTFSVIANGLVNSYQWQKDGVDLTDGGNIANATTNALLVKSLTSTDEAIYTCVMTSSCGPDVTTTGATLTLSTAPIISSQPGDQLICVGQPLTLSLTISNPTGVLYQWQKNGVDLIDGGLISGSKSAILTISSVASTDAGNYRAIVSTSCSTPTISNVAVVSTTASSTITKQPISANVCKTQSVLFVIKIAGAGITYQWQYKSNSATVYTDLVNGGKYSGVNTNSLTTLNVNDAEVGNYRCKVVENCGAIQYSAVSSITINSPVIFQNPFSQSICEGQLAKFTVAATGDNLVYEWYKDGIILNNSGTISGAKTATLLITSTTSADNGDYTCTIAGICAPLAVSQAGTLTVSVCTDIALGDIKLKPIAVFPNPAVDQTTISIKERTGKIATIMIYDMRGVSIKMFEHLIQSDTEKIDFVTADLPSGMYFVQVQFGDELYNEKVEVIH